MKQSRAVLLAALVSLTACEGLKEAMTAHVDVVARAEGQELSVQRLADLIGKAQVPVNPTIAQTVADLWISYQLLGKAAANGDSLSDSTLIDEAMWPIYAQSRTQKWSQIVAATWQLDTTNLAQKYASERDLLSASHILFAVPQDQAATGSDSVLRRAEAVLRQTTPANFAAMAQRHGSDGTKDTGGDLGVFPPQAMVAEFSQAVAALQPGQIGPLLKTNFGYHIVMRNSYEKAKAQFDAQFVNLVRQRAGSVYVAGVDDAARMQFRPNLAKVVKEVAQYPNDHRGDRTVVATSKLGNFTAGDVARWISGFSQQDQVRAQLQQAPDSVLPEFVKSLIRNEIFLHQADSANVTLDSTEVANIRQAFRTLVQSTWTGLRIAPVMLADSGQTPQERERIAAGRVDGYIERLLLAQEGFVEIPPPLATALREKYDSRVNTAGITRAVEAAQGIRAAADSARAAQQPRSAVPMPGDTAGRGARPPQ
ncbi:MAG TPA: peptidylprolyl isomerase [Gemmatimonadaceae bacterium]|nr:peptidylprolyl isomerase [Gemmatimonadaceae bacterium]